MELIDGKNLQQWLISKNCREGLFESEARQVFKQICEGVVFLHDRGIIHRDIKLDNILVVEDTERRTSNIKIIDFGLSTVIYPNQKNSDACGTIAFQSPEMISKIPHDFKTDVWSLGILLYILVTGYLPFVSKTV